MKLRASALAAIAALAAAPVAAAGCAEALGPAALVAASRSVDVVFRADPAPIAVSRHFALDIVVCPKDGTRVDAIAVDAHMPEHRHGMNYRPSLAPLGDGRYRAEGLLFHMPGAWEFRFDVRTAAGSERAVRRQEIP